VHSTCSSEVILTDDQIDVVEEFLARFKKSNVQVKTIIIQEATDVIADNWEEDAVFNREGAETVHMCSFTRFHAYVFVRLSANSTYITARDGPAKIVSLM
jgi:hypothetical protein